MQNCYDDEENGVVHKDVVIIGMRRMIKDRAVYSLLF